AAKAEQELAKAAESLDDATEGVDVRARDAAGSLSSLIGPSGVLAAGAVVVAATTRAAIDHAAAIDKGAKAARVSIDAFQGLDFPAQKHGRTFDELASAMFDFDAKVSKGAKGITAALSSIGLEVQELAGFSTEERLRAFAVALDDVGD